MIIISINMLWNVFTNVVYGYATWKGETNWQPSVALPSFVGWLGRRSLVAANRTSCPPGHGFSFYWPGQVDVISIDYYHLSQIPIHWVMCTNPHLPNQENGLPEVERLQLQLWNECDSIIIPYLVDFIVWGYVWWQSLPLTDVATQKLLYYLLLLLLLKAIMYSRNERVSNT